MNNITIEDIGIKKEIELAAYIKSDHYKKLVAVLSIYNNSVTYKVFVDDDNIKLIFSDVSKAIDAFNSIYI